MLFANSGVTCLKQPESPLHCVEKSHRTASYQLVAQRQSVDIEDLLMSMSRHISSVFVMVQSG